MLSLNKNKKKLKGVVVSDKPLKSIVVRVESSKLHPIYKKRIKWSKKYLVHDEENKAKAGDEVRIVEARPFSRRKKFSLMEIIDKETAK